MIEQDTVRLLRECDAGAKMGVESFEDVLGRVDKKELRDLLSAAKEDHEGLERQVRAQLDRYQDDGKEPSAMASAMSHMKTQMEMMLDPSDAKIADLMTDGCNMGIKSLSKYLNQYEAADESSKNLAKKLISMEETLVGRLRPYL